MLDLLVSERLSFFAEATQILQVKLVGNDGFSWLTALGWLGTMLASLWALYQWQVSRRVARMQYLDERMKLLREDPAIASATQLLDYDGGLIILNGVAYAYSVRELPNALMPHELLPAGAIFTFKEKAIRDAFDALFSHLDSLAYAVQLKIISEGDLLNSNVEYYLHKMREKDAWTADWERRKGHAEAEGAITRYLRFYRLNRALNLFEGYSRPTRWGKRWKAEKICDFTDEYAAKVDDSFAKAEVKITEGKVSAPPP